MRSSFSFLDELPALREILRTDVEAAYEGDPAAHSYEEIIVAYPSVETVAIQRMANICSTAGTCRCCRA